MKSTAPLFQVAGLVLLANEGAHAATYYAGPNASGDGSSSASPASARSALSKVKGGDTVIFLDGTYNEVSLSLPANSGMAITLRAADGAVPVFHGGGSGSGVTTNTNTSGWVLEGLWFENYGGGVELVWDESQVVSDLTIRFCVADLNSRNGFSPYRSSKVTVENNIASRNGFGPDSWSSNFNIYAVRGSGNVVRGNVAFHGIDTSSNHSDGNGFILDLTTSGGSALFENNLGFLNGGACIAVTDSNRAQLIGNTCYGNSQQAANYMDELNIGNTCRGIVDGIDTNSANAFSGLVVKDNVLIPTQPGKDGVNSYGTSPCSNGVVPTANNYIRTNDTSVFQNAATADLRPKDGSAIVDKVDHGSTADTDIGFDPKCLKSETDSSKKHGYSWWTLAPDLDYMRSIGGIKNCFKPVMRPQGSAQEYGAYEYGGTPISNPGGTSGVNPAIGGSSAARCTTGGSSPGGGGAAGADAAGDDSSAGEIAGSAGGNDAKGGGSNAADSDQDTGGSAGNGGNGTPVVGSTSGGSSGQRDNSSVGGSWSAGGAPASGGSTSSTLAGESGGIWRAGSSSLGSGTGASLSSSQGGTDPSQAAKTESGAWKNSSCGCATAGQTSERGLRCLFGASTVLTMLVRRRRREGGPMAR